MLTSEVKDFEGKDDPQINKLENFEENEEEAKSWQSRFRAWMRSKSYNPITLIYHEKENAWLFRLQRYT